MIWCVRMARLRMGPRHRDAKLHNCGVVCWALGVWKRGLHPAVIVWQDITACMLTIRPAGLRWFGLRANRRPPSRSQENHLSGAKRTLLRVSFRTQDQLSKVGARGAQRREPQPVRAVERGMSPRPARPPSHTAGACRSAGSSCPSSTATSPSGAQPRWPARSRRGAGTGRARWVSRALRPGSECPASRVFPSLRQPPHGGEPLPCPTQGAEDALLDMREHDVPHHVRFAIDTDVRCGAWYSVSAQVRGREGFRARGGAGVVSQLPAWRPAGWCVRV